MSYVAVYRTAEGPAQVFLLTDEEAPPTAALPGTNVSDLFYAKGSIMPWPDWVHRLEAAPGTGNWRLEQVPDQLTAPNQALAFVRRRELEENFTGLREQDQPPPD
jgi:hypothetical protein